MVLTVHIRSSDVCNGANVTLSDPLAFVKSSMSSLLVDKIFFRTYLEIADGPVRTW